jgi:hypothetical protein
MYGVIMAVGPGAREVDRMHDTLAMLREHEDPNEIHLVLVDDDPSRRALDPGWPQQQVIGNPLRRRRRRPDASSAMTAATVAGLAACQKRCVDMAIKLDTDAAVIAPFSRQIRTALEDPNLGVVGSYDRTSTGGVRDWSVWEATLARTGRVWHVTRRRDGRPVRWYKSRRDRAAMQRLQAEASRHAPAGAHCLGGAYAVSRRFLDRTELSWQPWVGTGLGEDVVVGILCAAAGLQMRSLVGPGEPFALAWQGLPGTPDEITAGGHSIVHSVKAPTLHEERRLRGQLRV